MLSKLKRKLYFIVAAYFGFWAKFVLHRWKPRVVVVTGSSGKTTLLHLIEAQLGEQAIYSHHANSSIGLPFLILGMEPNVDRRLDWLRRFLVASIKAWRRPPNTKLFVAEADCDRPKEGDFISKLLKPEVTLWVSVFRTHSMNFDSLVKSAKFETHEQAIAYEFGWFAARTKSLVVTNSDQKVIKDQLGRVNPAAKVELVSLSDTTFKIGDGQTTYSFDGQTIKLVGLHPKELGTSLQMVDRLLNYLGLKLDPNYSQLQMPPGRSNILKGKNNLTIVDSTYNTGLGAMTAILELFKDYPGAHKWLVLGDILEQGSLEAEEHQGLAKVIAKLDVERLVLLGPRTRKDTLPLIKQLKPDLTVESFLSPAEVLKYLNLNLKGGECLLFKGGRYLEGVIEQLLADPKDAAQLVRREASWVKLRQHWGLPG